MMFICVMVVILGIGMAENSCKEADNTLVKYIKWQMNENDQHKSCKCDNKETDYVAFHARLKSHLENPPTGAVVKFNEVLTNEGGAYDPNTGIFTCPVDGIYTFSWTLLTNPGKRFNSKLHAAGKVIAFTHLDARNISNYRSASQSAVVKLTKSDTVMLRAYPGEAEYAHKFWSSFSGFKI